MFTLSSFYHLRGQHVLARRIAEAQAESVERARDALSCAARALARRDGVAWRAACIEASAHYRCAGELSLASHWARRANI